MKSNRKNTAARILFRDALPRNKTSVPVEQMEDLLWMYVDDLLNEEEELRIAELMACDPKIAERMEQIRDPFEQTKERQSLAVSLACSRAAIQRLVEKAGAKMSEVAAVVVDRGRGLLSPLPGAGIDVAQPVMLGDTVDAQSSITSAAGRRVDVSRKGSGLDISLIYTPENTVNLVIKATESPKKGCITASIRSVSQEGMTEITAWMQNGSARIEDCPMGIATLSMADGRQLKICLAPLKEDHSSGKESANG